MGECKGKGATKVFLLFCSTTLVGVFSSFKNMRAGVEEKRRCVRQREWHAGFTPIECWKEEREEANYHVFQFKYEDNRGHYRHKYHGYEVIMDSGVIPPLYP